MYQKYLVVLAVGAFILDKKNRLLIIKKSRDERIDPGLWTIPGGKINKKEGIIDGLRREIKEEVGLEVSQYQWLGEDVFQNNHQWFHAQHFLCRVKKYQIKLEKKLVNYTWITKKEINKFDFPINIKRRITEIYA